MRGRTRKQVAVIDDTFVKASERVKIKNAEQEKAKMQKPVA